MSWLTVLIRASNQCYITDGATSHWVSDLMGPVGSPAPRTGELLALRAGPERSGPTEDIAFDAVLCIVWTCAVSLFVSCCFV